MSQEQAAKGKKRIKQIAVRKLFGVFDHTIPLNLDERVTIIHGPNGFGKTVMLKMLVALFSQDDSILMSIPFDNFYAKFEDNTSFGIQKSMLPEFSNEFHYKYYSTDRSPIIKVPIASDHKNTFSIVKELFHFQALHPSVSQKKLLEEVQRKTREGRISTSEVLLELYEYLAKLKDGEVIKINDDKNDRNIIRDDSGKSLYLFSGKEGLWIKDIRKSLSTHLIETQRLLNVGQSVVPTVKMYAEELSKMIREKLTRYASLSQSLDRTFPERVFDPKTQSHLDENEIRAKLAELEERRALLINAGLLDQGKSPTFRLENHVDDSKKIMLSVYIEDTREKLSVFNSLFEKIHLLTTIINNRFLYKKMSISKDQGFVFTSKNGITLPLESLSSGEQHELVLFFELLFKVPPGSLVLIDEPEISLHIVWQEQFLEDIQKVTRLADIDILIATHSPDIISNRWDLVVELKEPVQ